MKAFQRILAVLLCLVMSLGMIGMVASAAEVQTTTATIDTNKTGSIIVHKYEQPKTGSQDGTGEEQTTTGFVPMKGVKFDIYQVMTAEQVKTYYSGSNSVVVTKDSFVTGTKGNYTVKKFSDTDNTLTGEMVPASAGTSQTTGDDGKATFSDLKVGMYIIIESEWPAEVTKPADPFLVSIPMTQSSTDINWLYDVNVYPKNDTSRGNVIIEKYSNNEETEMNSANVKFTLQKEVNNVWKYVNMDAQGKYTFTDTDQEYGLTGYTLTFSNLPFGDYKLIENATDEKYILDSRAIEFSISEQGEFTYKENEIKTASGDVGENGLTIKIINEKPTIVKVINDATTEDPSGKNTAGVGDVIDVTVTVDVPLNIKEMKNFVVTDTPTGMKVNEGSVTVRCNGTADGHTAIAASEYSVDYTQPTGGFTFKFNNNATCAHGGEKLTITYKATITSDAITSVANDVDTASNTVTLKYDSTLGTAADPHTTTDDDDTKLYQATINKTLQNKPADVTLDGIKFKLYEVATDGTALKFTLEDGTYTLDPNGKVSELVTDTDGKIVINGLGDKAYYLEETETKAGYNLLSGRVQLTKNGDFQYQTNIVNKLGFTLPETGGIGTLMFIIIGGVLMAGGICLIVPNKKRAI